jgi:hypothetical protein
MKRSKKRGHDTGSTTAVGAPQVFWAIGYVNTHGKMRGKFTTRRLVSGRILARAERRRGELIRKAIVTITDVSG